MLLFTQGKKVLVGMVVALFVLTSAPQISFAQSNSTNAALLQQIQTLMQLIAQLQEQLGKLSNQGGSIPRESTPSLVVYTYNDTDDGKDGETAITITSPSTGAVYDKEIANDPIVISWRAENIPENAMVEVQLEAIELAGNRGGIGGGVWSKGVDRGDSTGVYRWEISGEGRSSAGTYKARVLIRECHSKGCTFNPDFPGQEENVTTYARSSWRTFKVVGEDYVAPPTNLAKIVSISDSENPLVSGTAGAGIETVGFSIGNGDKVYGSGAIAVRGGRWSHRVSNNLRPGSYEVSLYVNNQLSHRKNFVVSGGEEDEGDSDDEEGSSASRSFWWVQSASQIYGIGAYEPKYYPGGVGHSFRNHPQGEVKVNILPNGGLEDNTLMVLSSYEPVKWVFTGDVSKVKRVFVTGYHDQEVVGLPSGVEIVEQSYEGGAGEYFYAYDQASDEFKRLESFIKQKTGYGFGLFTGKYTAPEVVVVSYKG